MKRPPMPTAKRKRRKMTKAELATVRRIAQDTANTLAGMVAARIVAIGPSLDTATIAQVCLPLGIRPMFVGEEEATPLPRRKGGGRK